MSRTPTDKSWRRMQDAEQMVERLVHELRDPETGQLVHHDRLKNASIICLGKPKAGVRAGKVNAAKIRVASERDKVLVREAGGGELLHYTIEIGLDYWEMVEPEIRETILDHELCHAEEPDESGRGSLRPHDVQEFAEIIRRRGVDWDYSLQEFARAAREARSRKKRALEAEETTT